VDLDVGALDIGLCSSGLVYCANDGTETRRVLAARLAAGSSPAFGAPSTPLPAEVIPRGAVALDVAYCPRTFGADVGTLEIETDDPDPSLRLQRVALRGRGGVARLRVEPSPLEFGEVAVGAPARRRVWLINDGFVPVTVAEILGTSDGADVDVSPRSLVVAPGQRAAVWVTLTARAAGRVEGQLEIQSDDSTLANLVTALGATAVDLPPCAALVGPTELDFGEVEQGRSLGRALEIENLGAADCLITSVELESADGTFRLLEPLTTSRRLAPGRVTTVPIDVWPTAAQGFAGRVTVGLSSSVAPLVEIPLRAAGAQGLPLLSPTELDFGAAPLGCMTMERTATLYNDGVLPLTVTSLGLEPPDRGVFTVATSVPLPATLPPGTSLTITGTFRLTGPSAYATAARLVATRGGQPYSLVLPLSARVDAAGVSVERPTQRERPMLDILYVMDNSCGMGGVNRVVSSAVEAFVAEATTAQADYQLGVVTMDLDTPRAGQLEPVMGPSAQRVTPAQVDPAAALRALITGANSEEGSAAEQGLGAFVRALSAPLAYGWNLGLLRPEAELAVIVVSDEDDSSSGSTDYYLDALRALKGSRTPHRVQLSAVVGDAGAGCMGPVSAAAAGTRYIELARRSGGSFHSICAADWAGTLGELGLATFGPKATFALRGVPQPATLSVSVDGAMVRSTAWSYDAQTRAHHVRARRRCRRRARSSRCRIRRCAADGQARESGLDRRSGAAAAVADEHRHTLEAVVLTQLVDHEASIAEVDELGVVDGRQEPRRARADLAHVIDLPAPPLLGGRRRLLHQVRDEAVERAGADTPRVLGVHPVDHREQAIEAVAGVRAGHHHRRVGQVRQGLVHPLHRLRGAGVLGALVPLADHQHHRLALLVGEGGHLGVLLRDALRGVEQQQRDVAAIEALERGDHRELLQAQRDGALTPDARGVDEQVLLAVAHHQRVHRVARGAGHVGHEVAVLAEDAVDQRRLAHVRAADHRHADRTGGRDLLDVGGVLVELGGLEVQQR
jgi:hypothetical protein